MSKTTRLSAGLLSLLAQVFMNNLLSGVKFSAKQAKQFGSLGWIKHFGSKFIIYDVYFGL